jgi:hypothetical protein
MSLTPIGSRLSLSLDDEYMRMQNEWFFKWHHIGGQRALRIDSFRGKPICYGGIKYSGTARDIYWQTIQLYLRKQIGGIFDNLEGELERYSLEVRHAALNEVEFIVTEFAAKIRRAAIETDRILRGNGIEFPVEHDAGHWQGASPGEGLREIYCDRTLDVGGMQMRFSSRNDPPAAPPQPIIANFHGSNAGFIDQVKSSMAGLPAEQQGAIAEPLAALEIEATSAAPSQSKIHSALQVMKKAVEGAASNLIASGIGALIRRLLSG